MQHHDTITATSRDYVIKSEVNTIEKLLKENGETLAKLIA